MANKKITENIDILKRQILLNRLKKEATPRLKQENYVPIERADRSQALPLSWSQQRLWFLDQFEGAGAAYHIPVALRLTGPLDRNALQASLDRIVARHESLRTLFLSRDGNPVQVIKPEALFALETLDLRALPPDEMAAEVDSQTVAAVQTPFDLSTGPLIRGRLLQRADDDHILFLTMHHIVSDGWSMGVLVREVAALYRAYRQGQADPLPPLAIQYADYAQWQRQWLAGDTLQAQLDYWMRQLTGAPALLELPTDRPRPPVQSYVGASVNLTLDADLSSGLKALAKEHNATLYMLLYTGWAILLAKLSGQHDIVVGAPVANRQRTEVEGLIGFFVNTLALRADLSANPSVHALIEQVRGMTLAAYSHQDVPFEQVVEAVNPPRSMSHSPIFQTMLVLQNTPLGELRLPELTLTPQEIPHVTAQFDLMLSLAEAGDVMVGGLEYASDLFDRGTIERWIGYFKTILAGMVQDAGQSLGQLPWLSAKERRQVLVEFNATETAYPEGQLIHRLFEAQAAQQPDAVALVFEDRQLSYGELNGRANRLAHYLREQGVGPDTLVAICVERSLEMVVGLLGILKAGGAYVPLDPAYPSERLAYMLADAAAPVVLTQARLRDGLPATDASVIMLDRDWDRVAERPAANPVQLGLTAQHLAYVIYTSGSTGQPKGVMVEHRGLCNLAMAQIEAFAVQPHSRVLQFASFSFDACVSEIVMALCAGARLYLSSRERLMPGMPLLDTLSNQGITHVTLPPIALSALPSGRVVGDALTTLIVAGDTCSASLARQWAPGRHFINAYGPTEATVCVSLYRYDPQDERVPIGRPLANTQIYILDGQRQPVPIGVCGELYIGGRGVARGYLNRPELTAERFIADPFSSDPQARLYRTGDLGRWRPDGMVEFLGRNDHQVKIRGFRIELGEIEAQLAACAGVREAVVIAREDGPGDKRLVAYLTVSVDAELDSDTLRMQLKAILPDYMVPSAFVILDALPLTPNGKLDRKALPAPDAGALRTQPYEAPQGELEETLAGIWQDILQVERVGRHDSFFDLGGHSLLATQMALRVQHELGIRIPLITAFQASTIAALAKIIFTEQLTQYKTTDIERLVAEIDLLSEEELLELLKLEEKGEFHEI